MKAGSTVLTTWAPDQEGGWEGRRAERGGWERGGWEEREHFIVIECNGVSRPVESQFPWQLSPPTSFSRSTDTRSDNTYRIVPKYGDLHYSHAHTHTHRAQCRHAMY